MNEVNRILVVDDNLRHLELFSELLRTEDYEVLEASNGSEGLRLTKERRPDLVLLDVRMPGLDGIEVCRQIKADIALKDVFVVLFSGEAINATSVVGGLEIGADDYIIKGADSQAFLARIRTALRLQKSIKELRASEERFRQFAENINEVFWMTNSEKDKILYVSPAYEAIWGRSCQSLYASPASWLDCIHDADRPGVRETVPAKQISGDFALEYRIVRPDGSLRWIKDRAFPIRDESGKVYRIAGIAEDITERKQTEQALRESETLQVAIMEAALEGIITFDLAGKIIELNSAGERMLGCARAMAKGKDFCEVIVPAALREWFRGGIAHGFAGDQCPILGARIEMIALRADGSEFPLECAISRIELAGSPMFVAVVRDITDRRRSAAQASMLAHAIESTTEPICITDLEDRFTFVNRAFQNTYGYSEAEILGKNPQILLSPNNAPALLEEILRESRSSGWRGEIINRRKDGTEFPVLLRTSQIKDDMGRTIGLLGVAQDITELKRAQKLHDTLWQLAQQLSATITPDEAVKIIWSIAADVFNWDCGFVALYSQQEDKVNFALAIDTVEGQAKTMSPTGQMHPVSPLMRLIITKGARLINRSDPPSESIKPIRFGDLSRRSECSMFVPIRSGGVVLGALSIQSYMPGAYTEDDLKLLQTIADHCGDTLHRINLTEATREAEAKYRSIFEHATEGIFRSAPDGRLLGANPALARLFGYESPVELMSSITDVAKQLYVDPERRIEFKQSLETHGLVQGFETACYRKDGSKIWVTLNAHVARDADGQIQYYEGTIQNITENKQARQRLSDVLELNQTILASSSLGILAYRASGECVFVNEAASRIFHNSVENLLRQNFRQHAYWQEKGLVKLADETLQTRKSHAIECRWISGSAKELWLDYRFAAFVLGGELHLLSLADDITHRKKAEEESRQLPQRIIEAQEAERLRVARDLHDGVSQLIAAAKVRLSKVQHNIAASSPANAEILSRCNGLIVQALEEIRRLAQNLHPSDLDEFGLVIACRNLCKQFRSRTGIAANCRTYNFGKRLPPTMELNLLRIVQESLNNIENHAHAKTVSIAISVRGDSLVLQIRDNGRGFAPNAILDRRRKRRGMGLSNIRERAALLGGTSTMVSAPNQGTAITILVPLTLA